MVMKRKYPPLIAIFPLLYPVLSVRIKEDDTDKNVLTLGGWGF